MKRLIAAGACLVLLVPLTGQDLTWFGYYESQYMGTVLNEEWNQVYSNKLRLDLDGGLSDKVSFAANFNYITYHGKTNWNILDYFDSTIVNQVPPDPGIGLDPTAYYAFAFEDNNFLDNAYLKLMFDRFDLTLGKQQLSFGTGYAWNPLDVFNVKDLVDPTYEQPGHNAVRLDVPLPLNFSFIALASPEDTWAHSDKLIELGGHLWRFDYKLTAIEKMWISYDFMSLDPVTFFWPEINESRQVLGFSTAGELLGFGLWAEYGHNQMETSDDFDELVIGGDYTFDWGTYLMAEYFYYSSGKTTAADYDLNDWLRFYSNQQKALGRDQLYLYLMHPLTDLLTGSLSSIVCLSDGSAALVPTFIYSFSDNVEITAYLSYNLGEAGTLYDSNQGSGGMLRARIYF